MRKFVLALLFVGITISYAQIVTPGNGSVFTFQDLLAHPSGAVSSPETGTYVLSQDLTVSSGDTLLLDAATQTLRMEGGVTIQVAGCVKSENRDNYLEIVGIQMDSSRLFEWRFEDAFSSDLFRLRMENGEGIFVSATQIHIDGCEFSHFQTPVIRYMNCNPVITNSYFHDNEQAAINSGVNVKGAPVIRNNHFYHNVLGNTNQPQLNLGPGTATDTLVIEGNVIEGCSSMSGGIAVANLVNAGPTTVLLRNNTIENNRYGYTQQGSDIYAIIEDNIFRNNDLEANPMNGGSGISIYGSDTTCAAKLRRNLITGNLWGITAIYYHQIDMGTADDFGYNSVYDNANNGITYALYNNANSSMTAIGNYWGGETEEFAESVIYHRPDLGDAYGLVLFSPVLTENNVEIMDNQEDSFFIYPNPTQGNLMIETTGYESATYMFHDLTGRLLQEGRIDKPVTNLVLYGLPQGIYLLTLEKGGRHFVKKVILE